ncbi:MAG TPA: SIS domain-containing protein [Phaeodactylibacter sp.]|nr:SIS domain-containing protein [Phaeodactylibacter sp.]
MIKTNTYTYNEILQQPSVWLEVPELVEEKKSQLSHFLGEVQRSKDAEVILTGAGSSYFVGEMVAPFFQQDTGLSSRAVETTEIVTNPTQYINKNRTTLLISFARSGNSPESVAAVNLANKVSKKIYHIIITCNAKGALNKVKGENVCSIVLPEEVNDKSLAMTSSVTSMAFTALSLGRLGQLDEMTMQLQLASKLLRSKFEYLIQQVEQLGNTKYTRGIFLGSGAMKGVAHEAHLKLQELTDGEIICKFDSFLGFRHGPKAVVNNEALIVYFFSNDEYTRQYEMDLVRQVASGQNPILTIGICNEPMEPIGLDVKIELSGVRLEDAVWTVLSLVPAQMLAFYKSVALGYDPDSPSKSGAIHRVVRGVKIYDFSLNGNLS